MYRAMQIANYIIHLALSKDYSITNLHLQKIMYYLQAESLYRTGEPLFEDNIGKWRLGPVVPDVYHEYKEYGSGPIRDIAEEIIFDPETMEIDFVQFDLNQITQDTRNNIDQSILTLLEKNPFDLVDETHNHEPWRKYREQIESGQRGLEYENEEIREYFTRHPEKLEEVMGGRPEE